MTQEAQSRLISDVAKHAATQAIDRMMGIINNALEGTDRAFGMMDAAQIVYGNVLYSMVKDGGMPPDVAQFYLDTSRDAIRKAMEEKCKQG